MRERWEGSSSKSIKLISKHFDLLCLLLGNVEKFPLVCNFLNLLTRISLVVTHGVRLKAHNLHTLFDLSLKLAGAIFQLLGFHLLLCNFFLKFFLGFIDGLNPLLSIFLNSFGLFLETLLILLILFLMLTLDDLLCLFGDTIKLDIFGSLFEIGDFQNKSSVLVLDSLQACLVLTNCIHQLYFFVTSSDDLTILKIDYVF